MESCGRVVDVIVGGERQDKRACQRAASISTDK